MKSMKFVLILIPVLLFAMGCGGDDGDSSNGGAGKVESPVSDDTVMSEMSDNEAEKFCVSIMDAMMGTMATTMKDTLSTTCASMGASEAYTEYALDGSDADMQGACEEAVSDCEDQMADAVAEFEDFDAADECDGTTADDLENCDAKSGDVVDCLNAYLKMLVDVTGSMPKMPACSEIDADYFDNMDTTTDTGDDIEPETPAVCESVIEDCPEVASIMADGLYGGYGYDY